MSRNAFKGSPSRGRTQTGVSLLVVLILLLVTSVLGIAVLRSSGMQERMSANMRDRSIAMQGAESALRYAQDQVLGVAPDATKPKETWDKIIPTTTDCSGKGICPTNSAASWQSVPDDGDPLTPTAQYWIEYLGTGPGYKGSCDSVPPSIDCQSPMYRITVRSRAEGRADVMLQANIASRIPTPGT